jgi:hypothetical protein
MPVPVFGSRRSSALLLVIAIFLSSAFRLSPVATEREVRELPVFTTVNLGTSVRVVVRQGSPQQVVEAAAEDLLRLQTEVAGTQLHIERRQPSGLLSRRDELGARFQGPVTVFITLPAVRGLACSASGRMEVDTVQSARIQLAVSGSGQLRVARVRAGQVRAVLSSSGRLAVAQLQADTLQAAVSGSGTLAVAGTGTYASLGISSSGHLDAGNLAVQDCRARLSGSGSGRVQVAHTLKARLSSSGSLLVRGNPQLTS